MTKEEILKETIEFYSVTERRSIVKDAKEQRCQFRNPEGNMCAVGRVLKPEILEQVAMRCNSDDVDSLASMFGNCMLDDEYPMYNIDNIVKDEYKGFSNGFWGTLQSLHDRDQNWDENGLSESGKNYVKDIAKDYKLDISRIL